jgi:anti-sigma-K factor RskA
MLHRTSDGLEVLVVPGNVLAGARHIGVTVEPSGGSPARTGPAQVTGDVS